MEDQEAEQEEESAEECYYVQPSDQEILACLPPELKVLPEHSESAQGDLRYVYNLKGQRGAKCPSCGLTDTSFRVIENRGPKYKQPDGTAVRVDAFTCHAGVNAKLAVPCVKCPYCSKDPELQKKLKHFCPNLTNTARAVSIKPGTACARCAFTPNVQCRCRYCNVA